MGFSLGSEQNFQIARHWLETCWLKHPRERCAALQDYPLPTHLLDLGAPVEDMKPTLFRSAGSRGSYAAVSYCWGSQGSLMTTDSSYFNHTQGIAIPTIPTTLRDAMILARGIGFRYTWIDALCIVQDDPQDWERESAVMDQIYGNAAVTIAASASSSSEEGIFEIQRLGHSSFPCICALKMGGTARLGHTVQIVPFRQTEEFLDCELNMPLAKRGWAMQERYLPQRIVYCGRRRLYFQCRHATLRSDGRTIKHYAERGLRKVSMFDANPSGDHVSSARVSTVNDLWFDLVERFSGPGALTRISDRLPAIAGVANAVQRATGDRYMAGLWESDFARGLMWSRAKSRGYASCGRHRGRAPTWSWAAWDGNLFHQTCEADTLPDKANAELIGYHIELSGENPYGEVHSGTLFLRAWITACPTHALNNIGRLELDEHSWNPFHNFSNSEIVSFFGREDCVLMLVGLFQKEIDDQANILYGYEMREGATFELWGMLVLEALPEPRRGYYERLGMILRASETHEDFDLTGWSLEDVALV
jgi:hypothetical protein